MHLKKGSFDSDGAENHPGLAGLQWFSVLLSNWIMLKEPAFQMCCFYVVSSRGKLFYFLWNIILSLTPRVTFLWAWDTLDQESEWMAGGHLCSPWQADEGSLLGWMPHVSEFQWNRRASFLERKSQDRLRVLRSSGGQSFCSPWRPLLTSRNKDVFLLGLCHP